MKRRWLIIALSLCTVLCMVLGFAGCGKYLLGESFVLSVRDEGQDEEPYVMLNAQTDIAKGTVTAVWIHTSMGSEGKIRLARGSTKQSGFYNYVEIQTVSNGWTYYRVESNGGWPCLTYPYYKLTARGKDVVIDEIVLIAENTETGESSKVRLAVFSAWTSDDAKNAEALFDGNVKIEQLEKTE